MRRHTSLMHRDWWKLTQEIVAVISGVGTLFLGLVTFWITARISDLEDYFHSELKAKNEALAVSIETQRKVEKQQAALRYDIRRKELHLATLQQTIWAAEREQKATLTSLNRSRSALAGTKSELSIELAHRAFSELYWSAIFVPLSSSPDVNAKEESLDALDLPFGAILLEDFGRVESDPKFEHIHPLVTKAKNRMQQMCPSVFAYTLHYRAIPKAPDISLWHNAATKSQYDQEFSAHWNARQERATELVRASGEFTKEVKECLCRALSSRETEKKICAD